MSTIHETATELADLCVAKNAAYGDSVGKAAQMLTLLYPHGVQPEQYIDFILAGRDFDKKARLAQRGPDAMGEDPRLDMAGYALLALHLTKGQKTWQGSANDQNATKTPKALPGSAAQLTNSRTITNDAASKGPANLRYSDASHESSSAQDLTSTSSAPALTAQVAASASVEGQVEPFSPLASFVAIVYYLIVGCCLCVGRASHSPMTFWSLMWFVGFALSWAYLAALTVCSAPNKPIAFFDPEAE